MLICKYLHRWFDFIFFVESNLQKENDMQKCVVSSTFKIYRLPFVYYIIFAIVNKIFIKKIEICYYEMLSHFIHILWHLSHILFYFIKHVS